MDGGGSQGPLRGRRRFRLALRGNPSEVAGHLRSLGPMLREIDDAILQIEARLDRFERRFRKIAWFVAARILISLVIAGILVFGTRL